MKYRSLQTGDTIRKGDEYLSMPSGTWMNGSDYIGGKLALGAREWRRPIKEDNWISFTERKPTKEDAYFGLHKNGYIATRFLDNSIGLHPFDCINSASATHWMPLNFVPRELARIKVRNEDVIPNKDGSVKVGCTTIPKEDMKEIVRQWNEVAK
jgi:hypothetical protein